MSRIVAFLCRISVRILAFNLLVVFLPIAGVLYLDTYERQLLESLEHALAQQGRVLAAALSDGELTPEAARVLLLRMARRHEARLRILDATGRLLADSSRLELDTAEATAGTRSRAAEWSEPDDEPETLEKRETLMYRIASFPVRLYRRTLAPPEPPLESGDFYSGVSVFTGPEVRTALRGGYGAATRISSGGQRSVTLYSAIPVTREAEVIGVSLVSQSTYRILRNIYELRLEIFRIFLLSLVSAVLITAVASATITRPIRRLRNQAALLVDRRGRLTGRFRPLRRSDEIGDLSRALNELTGRLQSHMRSTESFAADVAHELKNPLASIRSATEIAGEVADPAERARFLDLAAREVSRMEHIVTGTREISVIDSLIEQEERDVVDIGDLTRRVLDGFRIRGNPKGMEYLARMPGGSEAPLRVAASPQRMTQVLENLVDNAAGFSPPGGRITVSIDREGPSVVIRVEDQGPGIPEEDLEAVFGRFFSRREGAGPSEAAHAGPSASAASAASEGSHLGLGLSIVRVIVEGYGGQVRASNMRGPDGRITGARLEVRLPAA